MSFDSTPDSTETRNFGLLTGSLIAVIFGLALPMLRPHPIPMWPWAAAIILILAGVAWPSSLFHVHWCWIRVGQILGWINSRIILTILFFVVILPMGAIMRARGRDPLFRCLDPNATTFRVPSRVREKQSIERPF